MVMVPKTNSSHALPDDVDALKALVVAERVENDRLRAIIKEFQQAQFGCSSEKIDPEQLRLALGRIEPANAKDEADERKDDATLKASARQGRPVEVRAYAERIEIRQDGRIVGDHERSFGRGQTIYDPWHYVPVLARKPGALRNGAPFKGWILPTSLARVRKKLGRTDDGDRQMVKILTAVLSDGLAAVEAACAEALGEGVHSADVVLNILARRREVVLRPLTITTPDALKLCHEPVADCARYDRLRRAV